MDPVTYILEANVIADGITSIVMTKSLHTIKDKTLCSQCSRCILSC